MRRSRVATGRVMAGMQRRFFRLLTALGVPRLVFALTGRRARVLMYHGVTASSRSDAPAGGHGRHVPRREFDRQMRWLRRHARPISLDELVSCLERGQAPPRRSVVVTFDDGYRNNRTEAWPILREMRIPATIYVTTGFVEGRPLWTDRLDAALEQTGDRSGARTRARGKSLSGEARESWLREITARGGEDLGDLPQERWPADSRPLTPEMLRELHAEGATIGSHTVDHEILTRCADELLASQLERSKRTLESWTGGPVSHFAYPNGREGDFDSRTESALRRAGYRSAVLNVRGSVGAGQSPWRIRRIGVEDRTDFSEFLADLAGIRAALLRLRDRLRGRG